MTRTRGNLSAGVALALAAAATTWIAMFSWRGFTQRPGEFLIPLLLVGATVALSGALGRWWRIPGPVVFLGQIVLGTMMMSWLVIGSPFPVGAGWTELLDAFDAAVDSSNTYAAPVPHTVAPVYPLLIAGGLAAMLLVDVLACTLRRVPLAGLPLLTVYSVPVSLLEGGISWVVFLLTAAGFLTMLFLHEVDQIARWGRPLGQESSEREVTVFGSSGAMRTSAGKIGGMATALAVVVPIVIPTITLEVFDFGIGDGGDSEIEIKNPMTDLQRDLKRGPDFALLTVTTDDPDPDYLRISVLNRFNDNEWSNGDRDVPDENQPNGVVPMPPGLSPSVPREYYDYDVQVTSDFESSWLPTQPLISEITADGDWRFDESTMDFIASDDDLTTAGLDYAMTAIEPDLEARALAASTTTDDDVTDEVLDLPPGVPSLVRELAFGVTEEAPTKFQKGVALQNWFREDGDFEYDLSKAPVGNGVNTLEAFLSEDDGGRVGYCEQFASAMAVMARILEHPGPGGRRVPRPAAGRAQLLRVQHPRSARLARALLRGRRLGAVRADARRPRHHRAGVHERERERGEPQLRPVEHRTECSADPAVRPTTPRGRAQPGDRPGRGQQRRVRLPVATHGWRSRRRAAGGRRGVRATCCAP